MKEKLITVNMTYARIALILLALNLLATGYTVSKMFPSAPAEKPTPVTVENDKSACTGCEMVKKDWKFLRG